MPWLPWDNNPAPSTKTSQEDLTERMKKEKDDLVAQALSLPPHYLLAIALLAGGTTALGARYVYVRQFRRIPNAEWVNPDMLARKRWVKGYVTSVGDADNFRLYHTPGFGWRWPLKFRTIPTGRTDLKDQTIHIRMAGVDAPEAGHFGRPAQPFAQESLAWLKSQVEGKFLYCQLVRRDQYGRIVAMPHLKPRVLPGSLAQGKCLPLEMLRAGWGSVYEQAGAEYGPGGLDEFLRVQKEAQTARRGIWKHGLQGESPAEYKRRYRDAAAAGEPVMPSSPATTGGWFTRFFSSRR
ncbi:SNase-domain-containing protein [Daedaleopsis nitida]|nr:SNase-domain-containing protein [Daedaleopsis nitida]